MLYNSINEQMFKYKAIFSDEVERQNIYFCTLSNLLIREDKLDDDENIT